MVSENKPITLINEAKLRIFQINPDKVVKILKGTKANEILNTPVLSITPGSIVTVTADFAKFLLTYKEFKVYGLGI